MQFHGFFLLFNLINCSFQYFKDLKYWNPWKSGQFAAYGRVHYIKVSCALKKKFQKISFTFTFLVFVHFFKTQNKPLKFLSLCHFSDFDANNKILVLSVLSKVNIRQISTNYQYLSRFYKITDITLFFASKIKEPWKKKQWESVVGSVIQNTETDVVYQRIKKSFKNVHFNVWVYWILTDTL